MCKHIVIAPFKFTSSNLRNIGYIIILPKDVRLSVALLISGTRKDKNSFTIGFKGLCLYLWFQLSIFYRLLPFLFPPITGLYSCKVHFGQGGSLWKKCPNVSSKAAEGYSSQVQGKGGLSALHWSLHVENLPLLEEILILLHLGYVWSWIIWNYCCSAIADLQKWHHHLPQPNTYY